MKNRNLLLALFALSTSWHVFAEEGHGEEAHHEEEEETASSVGPGNAIEEVDHDKGFRLSKKALKTLQIKSIPAQNPQNASVPKGAIVTFGADRGIYRLRGGFFKLLDIKVLEKGPVQWTIQIADLLPTDQLVVEGTGLLRVAELEASGGGASGHDH
jgi:hypothetical protein